MVDIITPLQKLDEAIHEFMEATEQLGPGGFVTGWIIGVSKARVQAEDTDSLPLVTGATYVIGPQTSVVQASGLTRYLDIVLERATWSSLNADEDDD